MSYDGQGEITWILQALSDAGVTVVEDVTEGEDLSRYADGSVQPYSVVDGGEPVPQGTDRGLGFDDTQPHIFPVAILNVGATKADVRAQAAKVNNALIGKTPATNGNSSQIRGTGGFMYPVRDNSNSPNRYHRWRYLEMTINLAAS